MYLFRKTKFPRNHAFCSFQRRKLAFLPPVPVEALKQIAPSLKTTAKPLSFNQARGVGETMLLYFECGQPGKDLENISKDSNVLRVGQKYRTMMDVFFRTQLHVIFPFGFHSNLNSNFEEKDLIQETSKLQKSLEDFSSSLLFLISQLHEENSDSSKEKIKELESLSNELLLLMLQKAFNIETIPQIEVEVVRSLSSRLSANLQDAGFLEMAEKMYKSEVESASKLPSIEQAQALGALQDSILVPCYLNSIVPGEIESLEKDDQGYVVLQTLVTQHLNDPIVAQNLASGIMALRSKVPLFGMPGAK